MDHIKEHFALLFSSALIRLFHITLTAPHYKITTIFTNDHVQSIDPSYAFIKVKALGQHKPLKIK